MRNEGLYKKSEVGNQIKKESREHKKDRCKSDNCLRGDYGSEASILGRTTLLGREVFLEDHRQPTGRAKDL